MKKVIIGEEIIKSFGRGDDKRYVLDGVNIEIKESELIAVMGPSGSGKSTLLFVLSGMDKIDGGKVIFNGRDLSTVEEKELSDIRRRKMGFVFQQPTLLKNLNILDNIILYSVRDNRKNITGIIEKAKMLMKKVGIAELEKRDIMQASGGQLQRAGICRALMNSPQIIFGDEPTGALNSKSAQEIMNIFFEINADGTAIMLVTHDAKIAAQTEHILFMRDGKIVTEMKLPKYKGIDLNSRVEQVTLEMRRIGI